MTEYNADTLRHDIVINQRDKAHMQLYRTVLRPLEEQGYLESLYSIRIVQEPPPLTPEEIRSDIELCIRIAASPSVFRATNRNSPYAKLEEGRIARAKLRENIEATIAAKDADAFAEAVCHADRATHYLGPSPLGYEGEVRRLLPELVAFRPDGFVDVSLPMFHTPGERGRRMATIERMLASLQGAPGMKRFQYLPDSVFLHVDSSQGTPWDPNRRPK